jgi:aminoglycoside phosphotransferase (APT) family kinase protein
VISNHDEIIGRIRHLLKLSRIHAVVPVGEGTDHWAFAVNGRFIARARKHVDEHIASAVDREVALLEIIARLSPIPVPEVVAAERQTGIVVFRRLAGISLFESPPSDPLAFAEPLAEFVARIHAVPDRAVEDLVERDEYALDAYLSDAREHMTCVASHLTSSQRQCVEPFLASAPPPEPQRHVFCHNDLGAEHILASEDRSELTGVIDWSDAAIADLARDVGRLLRDLGLGVADAVLHRISGDEHMLARAMFHARIALLEDLAYGIEASRPEYVVHALSRFDETFS